MEQLQAFIDQLVGLIWGPWLIVVFVGIGIYLTIGLGFLQLRKFPYTMKQTFGRFFAKEDEIEGEGTLTPRQAVSTALASTVGVGNIVGVASALTFGGPGAIFWMWMAAFFGMMTKYSEIVLSIRYREKNSDGYFVGGPAYYMRKGLNSRLLATIFTAALAIYLLASNMVQANAIAESMLEIVHVPLWAIGLVLMVLVAAVTLGGITRLGDFTGQLVPLMATFYFVGGLAVIIINIGHVPEAFRMIFVGAFSPESVGGGLGGYALKEAIRFGVSRGLYSNEAGMGTAPIVHATAKTDHPARQGLWGIMEVFVDTFIICTVTALVILTSGVLTTGNSPAVLAGQGFASITPAFQYIALISLIVFAYSTIVAISYYGETMTAYLGGKTWGLIYRWCFLPFTFIGCVGGLRFAWSVADVILAFAVLSNLIAILLLSPQVFKLTREFYDGPLHLK